MLLPLIIALISEFMAWVAYSETIPSIQNVNYKSAFAYIMNYPAIVVGENYQEACGQLETFGYVWKLVPTTNSNPACYSPINSIMMGADTWYCANGTLAYYNVPWWDCTEFNTCQTPAWTLSPDGRHCTRPNPSCAATPETVSEYQLLAAIVYGEASVNSSFEEKAAIANAVIRKRDALGFATINELIAYRPSYSSAVKQRNLRYRLALCSQVNIEYPDVDAAVKNALDPNGIDYANGGCYWDGRDLRILGSKHLHYKNGYLFTDPIHNIFSIENTPPKNAQGERGRYNYTYESTAGYGYTVFWKLTEEFMKAQGVKQCH